MLQQLQKHFLLKVLDAAERVLTDINGLGHADEEVNKGKEGELVADLAAEVLRARVPLYYMIRQKLLVDFGGLLSREHKNM